VKSVINPLPATGGTDREGRDQARLTAPLGTMALDRLVSVQDYADFARAFAGIGKASARRLSNGRKHILHLTIARIGDIPIDETPTCSGIFIRHCISSAIPPAGSGGPARTAAAGDQRQGKG